MSDSASFNPHHTKSAQELYNSGKAHCQNGQYDAALSELSEAAVRTPDSAAVHFWVGKAQAGRGDTADAVASFQRSARLDPVNAKPHLEMGRANVAADQLGAAMASFRQAQRLSPRSAEPLREVAAVLIQQCQFDAALDELQQALPLEPDAAMTHVLLGRVYELKGMVQQSDQAYRQAERHDPRVYAQAQVANGAQMEGAGRIDEAIRQYQAATLTDPNSLDAFRAAVRLDPNSYVAHYMLGWVLLEKSQVNLKAVLFRAKSTPPEECVRALRRAVELGPSEASARYALGKAYQAAGVRHLAREQFEQALALDPNHEDAASAREALRVL